MCVAEKRQIACLKNEAEDTEAQQLKKFEDEARQQKKIKDEAQREFQRKRNSKLMRQMQEVRGEQWLEETRRPLPDSYFPEVTY